MLRKCDYHNIQKVYAEGFEETELGLAIMNRLKKAKRLFNYRCRRKFK